MITKLLKPFFKLFGKEVYCQDGLITVHNHDFLKDPKFQAAYQRGLLADGTDYQFHWRVHVALWAAHQAMKCPGDFVECGVNRGFLSSAIMHSLDWNSTGREYFLLDTFSGPDDRFLSEEERAAGYIQKKRAAVGSGFYSTSVEAVKKNFSEWRRVSVVPGAIPETLDKVSCSSIAFMHVDLNCSEPEVAAVRHFWDRLSPGAFVLLDDYAYVGFRLSKQGMDRFAAEKGAHILALPTGQGLICKR